MLSRILTGLFGVPLIVAAVWAGRPWVLSVVIVAGIIAVCEFYNLHNRSSLKLPKLIGILWIAALIFSITNHSGFFQTSIHVLIISVSGTFISALWIIACYHNKDFFKALGYLVVGPIYIGILIAHTPLYYDLSLPGRHGGIWLAFAILCTFSTDTSALIIGKTLGRHAMAKNISPNKTWEGAIGGFIGAIIFSASFCVLLSMTAYFWQILALGATVGLVSQCGDLFESKIKRISHVKNASGIIPGHGGLLDRLDSLLWAIPAVYYLLPVIFIL